MNGGIPKGEWRSSCRMSHASAQMAHGTLAAARRDGPSQQQKRHPFAGAAGFS
jgi:hypothetical protein